jgi:hypothetical protein
MKIDLQACICIGSGRFVHLNMKGFASASELLWNNQCCGSKMSITDPNFFHPESGFLPSGSWIRIKEFKYLNPSSLIFYPDPGVNKAPDPGSASAAPQNYYHVVCFRTPTRSTEGRLMWRKLCPRRRPEAEQVFNLLFLILKFTTVCNY